MDTYAYHLCLLLDSAENVLHLNKESTGPGIIPSQLGFVSLGADPHQ